MRGGCFNSGGHICCSLTSADWISCLPRSTVATPQGSRASFISSSIIRRPAASLQPGAAATGRCQFCCCRFCCFLLPSSSAEFRSQERGRNKTGLHDKRFSEKDCRPPSASETMDHGTGERPSATLFLKVTTTSLLHLLYQAQRVGEFRIIQTFLCRESKLCVYFFTRSAAGRLPEFRYVSLPAFLIPENEEKDIFYRRCFASLPKS